MIGAMIGGILEYASMALGYNMLAVVVALVYLLAGAMLFLARRAEKGTA